MAIKNTTFQPQMIDFPDHPSPVKQETKPPPENKIEPTPDKMGTPERHFLSKFWTSFKKLFGIKTTELTRKEEMPFMGMPKVQIFTGTLSENFIKEQGDKFIFVLGSNAQKERTPVGQSSLMTTVERYQHELVELPVAERPVYDFKSQKTIATGAFKEKTDAELKRNAEIIEAAVDEAVTKSHETGKTILLLGGGYGTWNSKMYQLSPKTFAAMNQIFQNKLGVITVRDQDTGNFKMIYSKNANTEEDILEFNTRKQSQDTWAKLHSIVDHGNRPSIAA